VFRVLADPTRRRILDLLADRGPLTVGQLAAEFPDLVSSGISKHLMGLRAARLVTATDQGRQRLYHIDADALSDALAPWLARYEPYWSAALTRLRDLAEAEPPRPTVDRVQAAPRRVRSSSTRAGLGAREDDWGADLG
jgi:DNA-binding transcriptional ArsR family regulator